MPHAAQTVPYFPPPPTSATLTKSKSRSRSKSSSSTKSKETHNQALRPSVLRRSSTFLLPCLLILTFAIFILAVIYGYCVAKPHTQLTPQQLGSDSTAELDSSIFPRRPIFYSPVIPNLAGDNPSKTNGTHTPHSRHNSNDKNVSAALIFYLLTSPALLLILLSTELILHFTLPRAITGRHAHILLLSSHAISLIGLIISSSFWTVCELPGPQTTALEKICPAQVRGHFMYGIHELSIAKVAITWVIVAGLLWHTLSLLRSFRAQRRIWLVQEGHGEAQEIVIKMEEGLVVEGQEKKLERKRDRVVRFLKRWYM